MSINEIESIYIEKEQMFYYSIPSIIKFLVITKDEKLYWRVFKKRIKDKTILNDIKQFKSIAIDKKLRITDFCTLLTLFKLANLLKSEKSKDVLLNKYKIIDSESARKAKLLFNNKEFNSFKNINHKHLLWIHKFIFGGMYEFAGTIRQTNISKGGFKFANALFLTKNLETNDNMNSDTFEEIIKRYIDMNIIHPFQEGNGRCTRIWLDLILKTKLKKCVGWQKVDKSKYLDAMKASIYDEKPIINLLQQSLTSDINNREVFFKGIEQSYYYETEE